MRGASEVNEASTSPQRSLQRGAWTLLSCPCHSLGVRCRVRLPPLTIIYSRFLSELETSFRCAFQVLSCACAGLRESHEHPNELTSHRQQTAIDISIVLTKSTRMEQVMGGMTGRQLESKHMTVAQRHRPFYRK